LFSLYEKSFFCRIKLDLILNTSLVLAREIREATNVAAGSIIDEHRGRVTEENMEKMKYTCSIG